MAALTLAKAHVDLTIDQLVTISLQREEGVLSHNNALTTTTGKRTGRSPKDRFIVKDDITVDSVEWGDINQPISIDGFESLWKKAEAYAHDKELFVANLKVGADKEHALLVKVITEYAWHNIFCQHLFIKQDQAPSSSDDSWTLLSLANRVLTEDDDEVKGDGVVIINMSQKKVLLCGMRYAGEMKKAMFTVQNFLLPEKNVLPMHCAANMGEQGDVALFFGLSGTGKTTLSADPDRYLIGDDEHGWSTQGVFNFEGGCYAKCIDLLQEREPVIWDAIRDGAIMENVILDGGGVPDFSDDSLTQNTRAAYPRSHIQKRVPKNQAGLPKTVIFLTCDLYGVLPPVALLTKEQAAYYFLSGYTALVGSTEVGSAKGITPTFSRCFGAPFFPRPATVYADLLMDHVDHAQAQVYLINTGWTGGAYGKGGQRFSIPVTRTIVTEVISGCLLNTEQELYSGFNFSIPTAVGDINSDVLNPEKQWQDKQAYVEQMDVLIKQFQENFKRFSVSKEILASGPECLNE